MTGCLSLVATPIGNLEDITLRALRTLSAADLVLAEDTRHTRKLLSHHGISTKLRPFHAHSPEREVERCIAELHAGQHLALVSDAGTPLISDPGAVLIQAARKHNIRVESIPGPSAVATALCVSGVPFSSFRFAGFLPRSGRRRQQALQWLADSPDTNVLFEAPNRTVDTLQALLPLLGSERQVAVCRELTKVHEQVHQGTLAQVITELTQSGVRGEVTLIIAGSSAPLSPPSPEALDQWIREALRRGQSARDVARSMAAQHGLAKKELYQRVLEVLEAESRVQAPEADG